MQIYVCVCVCVCIYICYILEEGGRKEHHKKIKWSKKVFKKLVKATLRWESNYDAIVMNIFSFFFTGSNLK